MKKNILFFIIGFIVATGVTTVALSVIASDVEYDNTQSGATATTMQDAIDDLYDKANNMPKGVKVVTLGTATSYNIKELYPDIDYTSLTTANFYYRIGSIGNSESSGYTHIQITETYWMRTVAFFTAPSISYNPETGVLTCGNGTASSYVRQYNGSNWTNNKTATTTCYMVYAE